MPQPVKHESHMTNLVPTTHHDFQEVESYQRLKSIKSNVRFVQIRGFHGTGKRYMLEALMHVEKQSLEDQKQSSIIWKFPKMSSRDEIDAELAKMVDKLLENGGIISNERDDLLRYQGDERLGRLLGFLQEKSVSCVLGFTSVGGHLGKELATAFQALLREEVTTRFRAYIIAESKNSVFNNGDFTHRQDLIVDEKLLGFTDQEAEVYLKKHQQAENSGVRSIASYLGNNPLLLSLAFDHCIGLNISYDHLLKKMQTSEKDFRDVISAFKKNLQPDAKQSFEAMCSIQGLTETDAKSLETLTTFQNSEIPLSLVGIVHRVCQGTDETFMLQTILDVAEADAKTFLHRIQKVVMVKYLSPKGISIPGYFFSLLHHGLSPEKQKSAIRTALNILTGMFNKDNRNWIDDKFLFATTSHIDAVVVRAERYLDTTFTLENQNQDDFVILMSIAKLYEIKGQALVQTRVGGRWPEALESLKKAASYIWKIVCSYSQYGFLCFFKQHIDEDLLAYQTAKPVEEVARKIAESCIKAGKDINLGIVEAYFTGRIKLRGLNLDEFATNYSKTKGIALEDAKEKLASVRNAVENNSPLSKDHIEILRATGNFLSTEKIQKTFLAAQLCGIFHTYGRQDLYLWREMRKEDKQQLEMCNYYAQLSHHIARQVRKKTGVGLLYEFITRMNNIVPRKLQNRDPVETRDDRLKRFHDTYDLCKEALLDDAKYFEDGCYMATKFSQYTQLNASKYMVKAANKMLRDENQSVLPPDAVDNCIKMCELALSQMHLDMAPTCVIMAAKFYASMQLFDRAFKAFEDGYQMTTKDGKVFGVNYQEKQRPKLVAWTAYNWTRAVKSYFKHAGDANVELKENKKNEAINRCEKARNLTNQTEEWKKRMEECVKELRSLNV